MPNVVFDDAWKATLSVDRFAHRRAIAPISAAYHSVSMPSVTTRFGLRILLCSSID
jgi:hypothetical protein